MKRGAYELTTRLRDCEVQALRVGQHSVGPQHDGMKIFAKTFADAAEEIETLRQALKDARPKVAKWCHYQGNHPSILTENLAPIDAALERTTK